MSLLEKFSQQEHRISLSAAICMVTDFRTALPALLQPGYSHSLAYAETFNKVIFEELSATQGCVGIRAYFGMDDTKNIRLIFVGVDNDNCDLLPLEEFGSESENMIFEYGHRCPPFCGTGPLNPFPPNL